MLFEETGKAYVETVLGVAAGPLARGAPTGLKGLATSTTLGQKLFARGTGILNSNDYVRIGMGWKGSAKAGQEVFRLAIGNERAWIHWHFP